VSEAAAKGGAWESLRAYLEKESIAAFMVGLSSGFPYAMIGATLTSRLAQDGIEKRTVTAFSLALLVYSLKPFWAWIVDGVRLPLLGRLGQRVSWMLLSGVLVIAAVVNLALADPKASMQAMIAAAILVAIAGATYDIVIDAYRIETLHARHLGVGSGMSQYGWRVGSAGAGALALVVAQRYGWSAAYIATTLFALPAMLTALVLGEPARRVVSNARTGWAQLRESLIGPLVEFMRRRGAVLVLAFVLVHKIGDTLSQLTLRLLLNDQKYSGDEIAAFDIGVGFWAFMVGIFIGGALYARMGLKRSVLLALVLMGVSNFGFAVLAMVGHDNYALAGAIGFENASSGFGGVVLVAYFSALCSLRFTAQQYALISGAAAILGRFLNGTMAGALIEKMGYVNFYTLTTVIALPGILIFLWMMRAGLVDDALGDAGKTVDQP
jgi:PAT family beta-lactamase induction signal transducer AmpG